MDDFDNMTLEEQEAWAVDEIELEDMNAAQEIWSEWEWDDITENS